MKKTRMFLEKLSGITCPQIEEPRRNNKDKQLLYRHLRHIVNKIKRSKYQVQ